MCRWMPKSLIEVRKEIYFTIFPSGSLKLSNSNLQSPSKGLFISINSKSFESFFSPYSSSGSYSATTNQINKKFK